MILRLVLGSLLARSLTVGMTVLSIALSLALFLGVEKIRTGAQDSFADTISGTDLIVGARSGSIQLLLYSVFRIGNATNNISWNSLQDLAKRPEVDWVVPISLGDSHRQFRVMGTTDAFFAHYQYRGGQSLELSQGQEPQDLFDAVIGADVAEALGYAVGTPIVVAHGMASFTAHDRLPFRVSGILEKTGTPVDRTVIVSLEAIEAIHVDWRGGARIQGQTTPADVLRQMDLQPRQVTAAFVGVKSPLQVIRLQRAINQYQPEPLLAILPGVALQELWDLTGVAERALTFVSGLVVCTALLGMMAMMLASLGARRREMAIYRAVGAGPRFILLILMCEAVLISLVASLLGVLLLYGGLFVAQPVIDRAYGIWIPIGGPDGAVFWICCALIALAAIVSLLPALRAYRLSLSDGMMVRT